MEGPCGGVFGLAAFQVQVGHTAPAASRLMRHPLVREASLDTS
jgi:hypothetical protein